LVFAVGLVVQPVGAGSISLPSVAAVAEFDSPAVAVKHRKYKRREPKAGEVIAGAILLGVLGAAAASSGNYHYDDHYHTTHENYIRSSVRNCRRAARQRYRHVIGRGRIDATTRHVTYLGRNRYEVRGRVSRENGAHSRRFVCQARVGQVRRLDII
jgi:hypothetical protein